MMTDILEALRFLSAQHREIALAYHDATVAQSRRQTPNAIGELALSIRQASAAGNDTELLRLANQWKRMVQP